MIKFGNGGGAEHEFDGGKPNSMGYVRAVREGATGTLIHQEYYLANNLDVVHAVANGSFVSGWEHYLYFGEEEGRGYAQPACVGVLYGGVSP